MKLNPHYYTILLILQVPPPIGGGEIRAKYLSEYLKNTYSQSLFSRRSNNKKRQGKLSLGSLFSGLNYIFKNVYLIYRNHPKIVFLSLPKNFFPFIRTACVIWIAKLFNVIVLGELAGATFQFLQTQDIRRKIGLHILKSVNEIRVLGDSVKRHLTEQGITNTKTIDNGIYIPNKIKTFNENRIYESRLNLLYVGALNYSKGISIIIKAIDICRQNGIRVHLHLMGEWGNEDERTNILNYINSNSLNDDITFHGLMMGDNKWEVYKKCAILVHPTFWDGQPLTILEAMGMGLSIISTTVGAIPDTVVNNVNGILLRENCPEHLFDAIKIMYNDREYLARISRKNIETYWSKYTIESYCQRMKSWFEMHINS